MSRPTPKRPPPPIPRPGQVQVVRAKYKFTAGQHDELSFEEGDVLYILEKTEGGWWKAKVGSKVGLIPSNYVEEHTESIDNPLHEAAKRECARILLNNPRVQVNVQNKLGDTPLHSASWKSHADIVELLLEKGARPEIRNNDNKTAFDLSRDPLVGRMLRGGEEISSNDYGVDDEDSD